MKSWSVFLLLLWLASVSPAIHAQRADLDLERQGSEIILSWQSESLVPEGGVAVYPRYEVLRSSDLHFWEVIDIKTTTSIGGSDQSFTFEVSLDREQAFFAVVPVLDFREADFSFLDLADADFRGGNFRDASFFHAISREQISGGPISAMWIFLSPISRVPALTMPLRLKRNGVWFGTSSRMEARGRI